jgi:hypothetical protein
MNEEILSFVLVKVFVYILEDSWTFSNVNHLKFSAFVISVNLIRKQKKSIIIFLHGKSHAIYLTFEYVRSHWTASSEENLMNILCGTFSLDIAEMLVISMY